MKKQPWSPQEKITRSDSRMSSSQMTYLSFRSRSSISGRSKERQATASAANLLWMRMTWLLNCHGFAKTPIIQVELYREPIDKYWEIWMFVYLQRDAKQCCHTRKLDCTHCAGQWHSMSLTNTMRVIELYGKAALFGVFFGQTNIKIKPCSISIIFYGVFFETTEHPNLVCAQ